MLTAAIIAVVIAVAVVAVLVYAATKPDKFGVQRAANIGAPSEKIFPLIDDLHAHTSWSPFEKDPEMKRAHSGAARERVPSTSGKAIDRSAPGAFAIIDLTPSRSRWRWTC
jgi:hypothetical protein